MQGKNKMPLTDWGLDLVALILLAVALVMAVRAGCTEAPAAPPKAPAAVKRSPPQHTEK